MKYEEAVSFLYSFVSYERTHGYKYTSTSFDLSGFRNLLVALGNPQWSYRTIHIAGSDGKGSVAAMLTSVLREAGFSVGLYTSPHLEDLRERIMVDGEPIPKRSLSHGVSEIKKRLDAYNTSRRGYATFFDLLTALAFLHFRRSSIDVAVIETGLGGRLDATNVLRPEATIITHLSLEHTEQLGNTLEAIASEKLAISHPEVPCVVGRQTAEILPFIRNLLEKKHVPTVFVQKMYRVLREVPSEGRRAVHIEGGGRRRRIHLRLLGAHQPDNAATVCAAVDVLSERWTNFKPIPERTVVEGLNETIWPARFEILDSTQTGWPTTIVIDVAHTERGAQSLRKSLLENFGQTSRVLLMGFLRGKNIDGILHQLVRNSDSLICTTAPTHRGVSVAELHKTYGPPLSRLENPVTWCATPEEALETARSLAGTEKVVIIAGSLYLAGYCRKILLKS